MLAAAVRPKPETRRRRVKRRAAMLSEGHGKGFATAPSCKAAIAYELAEP